VIDDVLGLIVLAVVSGLLGKLPAVGNVILPVAALCALLPLASGSPHRFAYSGETSAAVHIGVALIGYALFTVAALQALLLTGLEKRVHSGVTRPETDGDVPLLSLERFLFRLVGAGFVLLTLTIASGLVFSEEVFGRPVTFTHKKGTISKEKIDAGLAPHQQAMMDCYTTKVGKRRFLGGEVRLMWELKADGSIKSVKLDSNLGAWDVEKCLLDIAWSATFDRPTGADAEFDIPLNFAATRSTAIWDEDMALRAVGGERVERPLEADGLLDVLLDGALCRVQRAVQHHRPDPLREGLGVAGADPGAVGEAEVGQLLVTQHRAQDVQVAHHLPGAQVGQHRGTPGALRAAPGQLPVLRLGGRDAVR
jgi:hypothetical protein